MLRLTALSMFAVAVVFGQQAATTQLGWGGTGVGSCNSLAFDAADKYAAYPIPGRGKVLITFSVGLSFVGTIAGTEVVADLVASTSTYGEPDVATVIESKNLGPGVPSDGVKTWSGFTSTLTDEALYYVVLKNTNSTPASNLFAKCQASPGSWQGDGHLGGGVGWSYYDGSSWSPSEDGGALWTWSDGETQGTAIVLGRYQTKLHTSAEVGNLFTLPPGVNVVVNGVSTKIQKVGTPTGTLQAKVYDGTTLVMSSNRVPPEGVSTTDSSPIQLVFASPVTLQGGKSYRVVWLNTAADSASNCYQINGEFGSLDGTTALALRPFFGTLKKTAWAPSAWTETSTRVVSMYLFVQQFLPASAGFVMVQ